MTNMKLEVALQKLRQELSSYESATLLGCLAGLQLSPENASVGLRLEYLANLAVAHSSPHGQAVDFKTVRRLFEGDALGDWEITSKQDPFSNLFVETIGFCGWKFRVLPGIAESLTFDFQQLLCAIFQGNLELAPELGKVCRDVLVWALVLSEEMCQAAGLETGTRVPTRAAPGALRLPADFEELRSACWFSDAHLDDLSQAYRLDRRLLTFLGCRPHKGPLELGEGPLQRGPLIQFLGGFLVAMPSTLCVAARLFVVDQLIRAGLTSALINHLAECTAERLRMRLNATRQKSKAKVPVPPGCAALDLKFDDNRICILVVVSDTLKDWNTELSNGQMHFGSQEALQAFLSARVGAALADGSIHEVFVILAPVGAGRAGAFGLPWPGPAGTEILVAQAGDLWLAAHLEKGDLHALLRFQQQLTRLKKETKVLAWSFLDLYAVYTRHKRSFYFSDSGEPGILVIECDENRAIREKFQERYRPNWCPAYFDQSGVIEIEQLMEDAPIFHPTMHHDSRLAFLVDNPPMPQYWLVTDEISSNCFEVFESIMNAVAYWLLAFLPVLDLENGWPFCIEVALESPQSWQTSHDEGKGSEIPEWFVSRAATEPFPRIQIEVKRGFQQFALQDGNAAELELVRRIITACATLSESDAGRLDAQIAEAKSTPLRKMLLFEVVDADLRLDPRGLTPIRFVSTELCDMTLGDLGRHLAEQGAMPGSLNREERRNLLNAAVAYYVELLLSKLDALDFGPTLRLLIEQNESIRHTQTHVERYSVYKIACFPGDAKWSKEHAEESSRLAAAALANRFLIEVIGSGSTCKGSQPPSRDDYDQLLALSLKVCDMAEYSDLLHRNLLDFQVEILPSGRLGVEARGFQEKMIGFNQSFHLQGLKKTLDTKEVKGDSPDFAGLDLACKAEWGYTLSDLASAFEALRCATAENPTFASLPRANAIDSICSCTSISPEIAKKLVQQFTLPVRKDFKRPPKPFKNPDIEPWRMQRPLSYLRRPLVEHDGRLNWGQRNLHLCPRFLVQQMTADRYKATSSELKAVIGKLSQVSGRAFARRVCRDLESNPRLVCKPSVEHINGKAVANASGTLGDIDVLCLDTEHYEIWVLECKSYERARVPHEFASQLEKLFNEVDGHIVKHQRRVQWVQSHVTDALEHFGIKQGKRKWRVRTCILVEDEIFAPYLRKPDIEIQGWQKFKERFSPKKQKAPGQADNDRNSH